MSAATDGVFSLETWFDRWLDALGAPCLADDAAWPGRTRRMIAEALSDASAEQFLNPLVASHLRHFGREHASKHTPDRVFWVRSEWDKVDLSYGLSAPFELSTRSWNGASADGTTGDLGQCEVKVCYTHLHAGKIKTLAGQLEDRRDRDRQAPGADALQYHGLVWLFQHGGIDDLRRIGDTIREQAERFGLVTRRPFAYPDVADDCGALWPSTGTKPYRCGMALALFELAP